MSLTVNKISFGHAEGPSYHDLSLCFSDGKLTCLIGPNGSGKSTLLRALLGFISLRSGNIFYHHVNLRQLSRKKLAQYIAYVPQLISFAPITIYDTVMLGRTPYISFSPSKNDHKIVAEVLEKLNLDKWKNRFIDELSGGERQKVLIAKALAQKTPVIFLDEPASSLDIRYQIELYELLKYLTEKEGKNICVVEHDLNFAVRYGDFMYVMKNGSIKACGTPKDIITKELLASVYEVDAEIEKSSLGIKIDFRQVVQNDKI